MAKKILGRFVIVLRHLQTAVVSGVGLVWALAGTAKLVSLVSTGSQESSSWVSEFPTALVVGVSVFEIFAAIMIFAGRMLSGLVVGLMLLTCFAAVLWIHPPQPLQACGCFGGLPTPEWLSPAGRIALFSGVHAILIAWVKPVAPR
jgi:hypothetical protein